MNTPNHHVSIDIATCPSCKRTITAQAVVQVKVEQPKPQPADMVRGALPAHPQFTKPTSITVTATPAIVGLDIDHYCGQVIRGKELSHE